MGEEEMGKAEESVQVHEGEEIEEVEEEEEEFNVIVSDPTPAPVQAAPPRETIILQSNIEQEQPLPTTSHRQFVPTPNQSNDNLYDTDYASMAPEDRPWNKPGADVTDYFNYGFNEETWQRYCKKQQKKRREQTAQEKITVYEAPEDPPMDYSSHKTTNEPIPHHSPHPMGSPVPDMRRGPSSDRNDRGGDRGDRRGYRDRHYDPRKHEDEYDRPDRERSDRRFSNSSPRDTRRRDDYRKDERHYTDKRRRDHRDDERAAGHKRERDFANDDRGKRTK